MDGFIGFRRSKTIEMKVSLIIIAIQFFYMGTLSYLFVLYSNYIKTLLNILLPF